MRIIGIDPGLTRLGVGIVSLEGARKLTFEHVEVLQSPSSAETPARLHQLGASLERLFDGERPDGIALERVVVDGKTARLGQAEPLKRGCTMVASPSDSVSTSPVDGVCIAYTEATLPEADGFDNGRSVPAEFTFSNGETLTANAGVIDELDAAGQYSRPSETVGDDAGR